MTLQRCVPIGNAINPHPTHTPRRRHPHPHTHTLSATPKVRSRANPHRWSNCSLSRRACTSDRVTDASVPPPPRPPRPLRIASAARLRISIAEAISARRASKAPIFSRTCERRERSHVNDVTEITVGTNARANSSVEPTRPLQVVIELDFGNGTLTYEPVASAKRKIHASCETNVRATVPRTQSHVPVLEHAAAGPTRG